MNINKKKSFLNALEPIDKGILSLLPKKYFCCNTQSPRWSFVQTFSWTWSDDTNCKKKQKAENDIDNYQIANYELKKNDYVNYFKTEK